MFRLGMTGEVISLRVQDRAPAPPTTARDELRRMLTDSLIRYYRHEDKKRTYRICDPAGYEYIESLDPRLTDHVEALTGKAGTRYPGSKAYRLKKRKEAMLLNALLDNGVIVDGAAIEGGENIIYSPTLTDAQEIIRSAPRGRPLFISGPVLKKKAPGVQHGRKEMSISAGSLIGESGTTAVYIISTKKFRWYAASETQTAMDVRRMREDALGLDRSKDRRLRALLLTETGEIAEELIKMSGEEEHKMDPSALYRLCYTVPYEDEQHASDVAKMLCIRDWKSKVNKVLDLPSPSQEDSDGITDDGKKIHNLLCCNIGRIKEIERQIISGKCRVIVHDWQKELLENIYGTELDAMVLSPIHFRGLVLAVQQL